MRLIDADKVEKSLQLSIDSFGRDHNSTAPIIAHALDYALSKVENSHTIDAVPVVRCRECKHMIPQSHTRYCTVWNAVNGMGDEGFCNYGERKEGADNEH